MRAVLVLMIGILLAQGSSSEPAFTMRKLDGGQSETAALADVNKDGRLDIVSSESWYEAPAWTKRPLRAIAFTNNYVDNFSDLPVDVNGDGFIDLVQIGYFARKIVWLKNPGKTAGPWVETEIEAIGPTEFAFLVDLNNDGKAFEVLPQFTGAAKTGLCWYELQGGRWVKRSVSAQSYGHGIGAGDINGDRRADIVTPQGWLEAPPDPRAPGDWTFHATDWSQLQIPVGAPPASAPSRGAVAGPNPGAQSPTEVVVEQDGKRVAMFPPDTAPSTVSRVGISLDPGLKTKDGRLVAQFMFAGWSEGSGTKVVVFAMVPRGGAIEYAEVDQTINDAGGGTRTMRVRRPTNLEREEFATYTLEPGQSREIEGLRSAGLKPIAVRVESGAGVAQTAAGRGATAAPVRPEYGFMYVIDLNKDGRNDVLTTMGHSYGVLWFEQLADRTWKQHLIDNSWSRAHASALADMNGDGQPDLVTGARFMGRNASETEPLALYWYEFRITRPASGPPTVQWTRHTISTGGDAGAGLQLAVADLDGDGDPDVVSGGKSGLFLAENQTKSLRASSR